MPTIADILGDAPAGAAPSGFKTVSDYLGPRPGSPEATSFINVPSEETGLERASRDFQGLQAIGMAGDFRAPTDRFDSKSIGRGIEFARKLIVGGLADLGEDVTGQTIRRREAGEPSNIESLVAGEPLPAETQRRALPTPLRIAETAGQGLVGSAPQVAAVAGAEAVGVPAPLAAAAVFGFTDQGFDPEQAAIAAALPYVGRYSGELVNVLARKFGVSSTAALNTFKNAGGVAGAAAYLATIDESKIRQLPPEQQHEARLDELAGLIGQSALGPIGVKPEVATPGEVAGAGLRAGIQEAEPFLQARTEVQAQAGGEPIEVAGRRGAAPGGLTPQDFLGPNLFKEPIRPTQRQNPPRSKFKPTVPEGGVSAYGPGEMTPEQEDAITRYLQVAQARHFNAKTVPEIKALFNRLAPEAMMNNAQAREIRNAAWGPPAAEEPDVPIESLPLSLAWPAVEPNQTPIRIQRADGTVVPGLFNGYYQYPGTKFDKLPAVAYAIQSGGGDLAWSHGFLHAGDQILDTIPTFDEWAGTQPTPPGTTTKTRAAPGANFTATTPIEGHQVKGNFVLRELDQVQTSFDQGYPEELQTRDRSRQASKEQRARILQGFEPQRLGHAPTTDLGAPWLNAKGQVLSGNLRTDILRNLYATGRDKPYREWLKQNAAEFGIDPEIVDKMARPGLFHQVTDYGGISETEFARQSNQQQVAGMSAGEKAASDARLLLNNPQLMDSFLPGEGGNVLAASNREFLQSFINGTGDRAELLAKDGSFNGPVLRKRVEHAVLGAMLGIENQPLVASLIEDAERLNVRTAANSVIAAAPQFMKLRGSAYDMSAYLGQALKDLIRIRQSGEKLEQFLDSQDFLSGRSLYSDLLLQYLGKERSGAKLEEAFGQYGTRAARALTESQTKDIFGVPVPTREELIRQIYERPGQGPAGPTETDLPPTGPPGGGGPGGPAPGPGLSGPAGGGTGGGPGAPRGPTIFTNDAAAEARRRLQEKLKRTNIGIDPTILADLAVIAGNKIEAGFIKYADYVKEMLRELGEEFRPYFKAAYNQVREYTEAHQLKRQMTSREEVEAYEQQATGTGPGGVSTTEGAGGGPQSPGTVRGAGFSRRPGIRVVDEGDLPPARSIVRAQQYTGPGGHAIDETQRLAINQALTRFEDGGEAFLLGDGTGVGKTGTELAIAHQTMVRTKLPSLIVTQNIGIIQNRFKADARKFGIPLSIPGEAVPRAEGKPVVSTKGPEVEFITFADLSRGKVPNKKYGVVIFDEAHNLKNAGSSRNFHSQLIEAQHKVFATATPMDTPTHAAYFLAQLTGETPEAVGRKLGYTFVTREVNGQERTFTQLLPGFSWAQVVDNIKAMRNQAVRKGSMIRREYPFFGQANFHNTPGLNRDNLQDQIAIEKFWDAKIKSTRNPNVRRNFAGQRILELSRWLEQTKVDHVLPQIQEDLKAGRKVVLFAEGYSDTHIKGLGRDVHGFLGEMAKALDQAGIKYLKLFEDTPKQKAAAAAAFQRGEAPVILATPQSGGAGIDLDDIVGDQPRSAHFVTMNFSGDLFDQMLGRVSRRNTASPAQVHIWRTPDGLADRRRQQVLDQKLQVLRNIQAGQDLDVNRFVEQARSEEQKGMRIDTGAPRGQRALDVQSPEQGQEGRAVQGRQQAGALQGRLSGSARAAAQNARALRTSQQSPQQRLANAAARINAQNTLPPPVLFSGLRRYFAPQTLSQAAKQMAGIMRAAFGKEYGLREQAEAYLDEFRKEFDKTPVARGWKYDPTQPLPRNYEVMRAIDTGQMHNLTPIEAEFARKMRVALDQAIDIVQQYSPDSLRNLIQNYFPRLWENPNSRENMARIGQLLRRPWEGPKSFLRKRVLEYFTDGLGLGLRPVSDNPVDVTLQKLGEMYRFAATRRTFEEAEEAGLRKFVYVYERPPLGWVEIDDPSSDVLLPPVVTRQEAFDDQIRKKTLDLLKAFKVPHQRLVKMPRGGPRGAWGLAYPGSPGRAGRIISKFGGPDEVLWHEFGHQMDWYYPELRKLVGATSPNSPIGKELSALADKRFAGRGASAGYRKYVREAEEKMANLFHAYVGAPELLHATAPLVEKAFKEFLDAHPELKVPLDDIKPSLVLGSATTEEFLGGPIKIGRWMMPGDAAQVVQNHLSVGMGQFKWFRAVRQIESMLNAVQLLGFFHGQFVNNDVFFSAIGLPIYDVMQGKPMRALKSIGRSAVLPYYIYDTARTGAKVRSAIAEPQNADPYFRQIAELATEANLRSGHSSFDPEHGRRWVRAIREMLDTPSTGAAWEALWRTPFAAIELTMKPVMDHLVPIMKYGIFAEMARRVIEDNPGASRDELRRLLGQAADAAEDRLGQVTYDNLFQHRVLKDVGQFLFRSYGWHFTKYRMAGGAGVDWAKYGNALARGEKPEVTFRMAYLPAMVAGHMILGAVVTYMLTRKAPKQPMDYFFPDTGAVDAYGNKVRLSIADFVKDFVADFRSFPHPVKMAEEWIRKLAPVWNIASEMYRNQDFYGEKIFSQKEAGQPNDEHVLQNLREGLQFMRTSMQPFSATAGERLAQTSLNPAVARLLPWIGYVPAPRYATMTPAEAKASDISRAANRKLTHDQAARSRATAELIRDLRTGKVNDEGVFEARARAAGVRSQADLTTIKQRVLMTPLQYQVHKMETDDAMIVFDLANDQEKINLTSILADKLQRAADSGRLTGEKLNRYVKLLAPWVAKVRQVQQQSQQQRERYSAFTPQP